MTIATAANCPKELKGLLLLVEDDDDFRKTICEILTREGYEVREASDVKSAQTIFNLEKFDAVISDIHMPHGDGIGFFHFVNRTRRVPFILMTGFKVVEEIEDFDAGPNDFLAKPFKSDELLACLHLLL